MMRVVAELMIMANAAVGGRVAAAFPRAALLRRHPPPRREAFAEVAALCGALGRPLDLDAGPAALAGGLAAAAAGAPPALASLIKGLAARAMSEAQYFCTGAWGAGSAQQGRQACAAAQLHNPAGSASEPARVRAHARSRPRPRPRAGDAAGREGAGWGHFGLALPYYTHFTSPIR